MAAAIAVTTSQSKNVRTKKEEKFSPFVNESQPIRMSSTDLIIYSNESLKLYKVYYLLKETNLIFITITKQYYL